MRLRVTLSSVATEQTPRPITASVSQGSMGRRAARGALETSALSTGAITEGAMRGEWVVTFIGAGSCVSVGAAGA